MALAEPADRRVARHRADLIAAEADQRDRRAHPRGAAAAASQPAWPPPTTMMSIAVAHARALPHQAARVMPRSNVPRGTLTCRCRTRPNKRVEHVLDAGPAGHPVERAARLAQRLRRRSADRARRAASRRWPSQSPQRAAMARVDRDLAFGRQQRPRALDQAARSESSMPSPVFADTARSARRAAAPRSALGWTRIARSSSGIARGSPSQRIRSAASSERLGALDADRLDLVVAVAQPGGVDQQEGRAADRRRRLDQIARRPRQSPR